LGYTIEVKVDNNTLQLHDKVQKLIEQYTIDKKRLNELEAALNDKSKDSSTYLEQIKKLQSELQSAQNMNSKLTAEIAELKTKNQILEKNVSSFESFADDLNAKIDNLIPKIEKL